MKLKAKYITRDTQHLQLSTLSEMVTPVNEEFEERVVKDIQEQGLLRPLVAVIMSAEEWEDDDNPDILPPPSDSQQLLRIQCGNVRYRAAKRLGYQTIDCVIFDDISEAAQYCAKMRKEKWT